MASYLCVTCNVVVSGNDRKVHSASAGHIAGGGSSTVVTADYQLVAASPTVSPDGMIQTKGLDPNGMIQTK